MFKIKDSTIHCSRGDGGTIKLTIPITDINDLIKYIDTDENIYWYNKNTNKVYDNDYELVDIDINDLSMVKYQFVIGDIVEFKIYEKQGYDKEPLVTKQVTISSSSDYCEIPLTENETTIGEIENKPITYWYDITLNGDQTVVCYNEEGAKEFIEYPAKGSEE